MAFRNRCNQCNAPSKYCCPRCHVFSCSVLCINTHKKQQNCSGERDKTAFVQLKDFSDINLLNDYRFLEETSRIISNASRDKTKHYRSHRYTLPMYLHKLRKEARIRGIMLKILPPHFTQRKSNNSYYSNQEKLIYWKIKWIFSDADTIYNDILPENTVMNIALEKYIDPDCSCEEIKRQLIIYQAASYNGIKALHYDEKEKKFYELDTSQTIKRNLEGKTIIEFPSIYVILASSSCAYDIAEIDIS